MTEQGAPAPATRDALAGIRVLDFTGMLAGPWCARLLADLGAEVIKLEPPEGDHIRARPPRHGDKSAGFAQLNCGKKSVALDLKTDEGRDIARRLAARSDVLLEAFRPGVIARLGLGFDSLRADNPGLIFCSLSGFGQDGPNAQRPAYAPVIHAESGYQLAQNRDGDSKLPLAGVMVADILGGTYAFAAIQTALYHRAVTGKGQHIDCALMDSMLNLLTYELPEAQFPDGGRRPDYPPFATKTGAVTILPVSQKHFQALAGAVGHPEWLDDSRFSTVAARGQNWDGLMTMLAEWAATKTSEEIEELLSKAGCPFAKFKDVGEAIQDPALHARGALVEVDDGAGPMLVSNVPFRFSAMGAGVKSWVPELGANNKDVLRDVLGLAEAEIARLEKTGILHGTGDADG